MKNNLNENLIIRKYRPGDEKEIVELLKFTLNWPSMNLNTSLADHWNWKFLENPIKQGIVIVCESDDQIVGCSHVYFMRLKLGDKIILCGNGVDVAVHPNFRRRGIFNRMTHARKELMKDEGVDIAFWSTGNPVLQKKWKIESKPFPYKINTYMKPYNLYKILTTIPVKKQKIKKYGYLTLKMLNKIFRENPSRNYLFDKITQDSFFDKKVDNLWKSISPQYDFAVERTQVYLNWRYCDPRSGKYTIFQLNQKGEFLGYIVVATNTILEPLRVDYIVDFFTVPEKEVIYSLLNKAINFFEDNKTDLIICLVPRGNPMGSYLNRYGFLNSKQGFHLYYDSYTGCTLDTIRSLKTHFNFGDRDSLPLHTTPNQN